MKKGKKSRASTRPTFPCTGNGIEMDGELQWVSGESFGEERQSSLWGNSYYNDEKVYGKKMINGSAILVQGSHFRSVNQTKSLFFNREKALEWLKLKSAYMGKKLCSVLDSRWGLKPRWTHSDQSVTDAQRAVPGRWTALDHCSHKHAALQTDPTLWDRDTKSRQDIPYEALLGDEG